jgi:uroporphyrinogen-III synthase
MASLRGQFRPLWVTSRHQIADELCPLSAIRGDANGFLREIGLDADIPADEPTTEGIIAAMRRLDLSGRSVGMQLNPGNPNRRLLDFMEAVGAVPYPVLPYVYVSEADDARVLAIINDMAAGQFDAIAFTSAPQVRRLRDVARATGPRRRPASRLQAHCGQP